MSEDSPYDSGDEDADRHKKDAHRNSLERRKELDVVLYVREYGMSWFLSAARAETSSVV